MAVPTLTTAGGTVLDDGNGNMLVAGTIKGTGEFDAAQVALGSATTYTLHKGANDLLLGHAITFSFYASPKPGDRVSVLTTQGAAANYAVTWPAELSAGDSPEPAVTASNGAIDLNEFVYFASAGWILVYQGLAQA